MAHKLAICQPDNPLLDGTYNIRATSGEFLSVLSEKDSTSVDLFEHDDCSGRQRWAVESVLDGESIVYRIDNVNGRPDGSSGTLSCQVGPDNGTVDLFIGDDGSGRQHWWLIPHVMGDNRYHICVGGGRDGKRLLSRGLPGHRHVDLWWRVEDENQVNTLLQQPAIHSLLIYCCCLARACLNGPNISNQFVNNLRFVHVSCQKTNCS